MMDVQQNYTLLRHMTFGQWLKEARLERGYSLRELALRANNVCTFSYLAQIERENKGKKGQTFLPDVEIVEALAVALDKDVDEARLAAGYAPKSLSTGKPQTVPELLNLLEKIGVEHIEFADKDRLAAATPDDLQDMLDAIRLSIEITLQRRHVQQQKEHPTNDPRPATELRAREGQGQ